MPARPVLWLRISSSVLVIENDSDVDETFVLVIEIEVLSTRRRRVTRASPFGREFDDDYISVEAMKGQCLSILVGVCEVGWD